MLYFNKLSNLKMIRHASGMSQNSLPGFHLSIFEYVSTVLTFETILKSSMNLANVQNRNTFISFYQACWLTDYFCSLFTTCIKHRFYFEIPTLSQLCIYQIFRLMKIVIRLIKELIKLHSSCRWVTFLSVLDLKLTLVSSQK